MMAKTATTKAGCDYSYTLLGRGKIIAASNNIDGYIEPKIKES